MEIVFERTEGIGNPGDRVVFDFRVVNDAATTESYEYRLEADDGELPLSWGEVGGPSRLDGGDGDSAECLIDIPERGGPAAGPYEFRVVVVCEQTRMRVATGCVLAVEARRCVAFPRLPAVRLQPDGSLSASVSLVNCGSVDVNVSISIKHEDGWTFDVQAPEFHVKVGEEPFDVDVKLRVPDGRRVNEGDDVEVEAECEGETLARDSRRVESSGRARYREGSRRRMVGVVAAAILLIAGGVAVWQGRTGGGGGGGEVVFDEEVSTEEESSDDGTDDEPATEFPDDGKPIEILSFDIDANDCEVFFDWETNVPVEGGRVKLLRDGEVVYETEPGSGSYTDEISGGVEQDFTYELVAENFAGETSSQEETVPVSCPDSDGPTIL